MIITLYHSGTVPIFDIDISICEPDHSTKPYLNINVYFHLRNYAEFVTSLEKSKRCEFIDYCEWINKMNYPYSFFSNIGHERSSDKVQYGRLIAELVKTSTPIVNKFNVHIEGDLLPFEEEAPNDGIIQFI